MISDTRQPLCVERSPWLRGVLPIPGDIVLTHLALMVAAVARGETTLAGPLASAGVACACRALQAFGVGIDRQPSGGMRIAGLGVGGLLAPTGLLDLGGSRLAAELAMGLVGTYDFEAGFRADPEVAAVSFAPLLDALRAFGTRIEDPDPGRLPLALTGPSLAMPVERRLPPRAPATKAALLLAALNAPGRTCLLEPEPGWAHAERLLRRFGATLDVSAAADGAGRIEIAGLPELRAQALEIPADPDLAALGAVAAATVPGSEIDVGRVCLNPARTALLSALVAMGADIEARNLRRDGEEEIGDLVLRHAPLRAIALAGHHVAPLLDGLPVLAVAAAYAEGQSAFYLPAGISLLDQARLAALARHLAANGVDAEFAGEALLVSGGAGSVRGGGGCDTDDPATALAMMILGMGARERVTLADTSVIKERFPGFVDAFEAVGAGFVH